MNKLCLQLFANGVGLKKNNCMKQSEGKKNYSGTDLYIYKYEKCFIDLTIAVDAPIWSVEWSLKKNGHHEKRLDLLCCLDEHFDPSRQS